MLKAGLDEVFRSVSIDFEVGFLSNSLGHTRQMEYLIHSCDSIFQRTLVAAIALNHLNRQTFEPFQVAQIPQKASDLVPSSQESLDEMASNKTCGSGHQ